MSWISSSCGGMAIGGILALMAPQLATAREGIVGITRFGGSVELTLDLGHQEIESASSEGQKRDQALLEEKITLDLGGFSLAPELLTFDLGGTVGFRQNWLGGTDVDPGFGHGRLLEYNASTSLFPSKPLSLTFFANRFDDQALRNFGTDTETQGDSLGSTLILGNRFFPSTFTWQRMHSRTQNHGALTEGRREEERESFEFSGYHFSEERQIRIRLRDEDVEDNSQPAVADYHVREANGSFGFRWGRYFEKSWRTSGRFFQRKSRNSERGNKSSFQNISGSSAFRWDLTEDFSSHLSYDFGRFESSESNELLAERSSKQITTSHNGIFSLRHRFYESITTDLRAFGDISDRTGGGSLAYGGDFSFNYRKRLPWSSSVLVAVGAQYRIQDVSADSGALLDGMEEVTVVDSRVLLKPLRVVAESIEIFDAVTNQELLVEQDYIVVGIGDLTSIEILLLPDGSEPEWERLIVLYRYQTDSGVKTGTLSQRYSLGWDAGWMLISYDHTRADEELLSGLFFSDLQKTRRDSVQLELRKRFRTFRASFTSQFTHDRTAQAELDEYTLGQRLSWRPRRNLDLEAHFRESWRNYSKPEKRRRSLLRAGGSLSWRLAPNRRLRLFAEYGFSRNSQTDDQNDLELGGEARFLVGRIEINPHLSWLRRERGESEMQDLRGTLHIRRRF